MSWVVDSVPRVRIGQTDGPPEYLFGKVVGAVRLNDGRIVIADGQTNQLRFFDSAGVFIETTGRRGQGPGEFENFSSLFLTVGDSIVVTDYEGSRYHVLDPDGQFVRRFRMNIRDSVVRLQYTSPRAHAVFADGSFLLSDHIACPTRLHREPGICVDSARFMRVTEAGERLGSFGNQVSLREERVATAQGLTTPVRGWLAPTFWGVHGSRFYFADATTFEIRIYSASGALERIVRADYEQLVPPSPIPEQKRGSFEVAIVGRPGGRIVGPSDPRIRAALDDRRKATIPERMHAYAGFQVDRAGNMWVREYIPYWIDSERSAHRWWVFDSTGVLRHTVFVPPVQETRHWLGSSYRGPEIGDDYILGMRYNEDGAEEIVMYVLGKSPPR
jgi:hypothetical protein